MPSIRIPLLLLAGACNPPTHANHAAQRWLAFPGLCMACIFEPAPQEDPAGAEGGPPPSATPPPAAADPAGEPAATPPEEPEEPAEPEEEATELDRVRAIDRGRALFPEEVRLAAGATTVEGETQGRERGLRMQLRRGDTVRLHDRGGDAPGIELIGPDGHSAWIGVLGKVPVDLVASSAGTWEVDILGYAGAQGRNSYDLRVELVPTPKPPSPKEFRGKAGDYPCDLLGVPSARNAFVRALDAAYEPFRRDMAVQSPMVEVEGRWLLGSGCLENACPDGGAWFVVDLRDGTLTAARYGRGRARTLLGTPEALPPAVQAAIREITHQTDVPPPPQPPRKSSPKR